MTLPSSGNTISLYQIKDEGDGGGQDSSVSTGSSFTINDSDIRALISGGRSSGAQSSFGDFYGLSGSPVESFVVAGSPLQGSEAYSWYISAVQVTIGSNATATQYLDFKAVQNGNNLELWAYPDVSSGTAIRRYWGDGAGAYTNASEAWLKIWEVTNAGSGYDCKYAKSESGDDTGAITYTTSGSIAALTTSAQSISSDRAVKLYQTTTSTPGNSSSTSLTSTMTFTFTKSGETTYAPAFAVSWAQVATANSS